MLRDNVARRGDRRQVKSSREGVLKATSEASVLVRCRAYNDGCPDLILAQVYTLLPHPRATLKTEISTNTPPTKMRFTLPLMSLMLTSAFAMTIAERQNDVPVCKNGEIDDAAVGGPWPASKKL